MLRQRHCRRDAYTGGNLHSLSLAFGGKEKEAVGTEDGIDVFDWWEDGDSLGGLCECVGSVGHASTPVLQHTLVCEQGEHSASITTVAWSPSGRYLATAAEDGQILVWDADDKLDLNTAMLDAPVSGLAWCPGHNALAACTADGAVALWQCPVPGHMPLPCSAPLAPSGAGAGTGPGSGASQPGTPHLGQLLQVSLVDVAALCPSSIILPTMQGVQVMWLWELTLVLCSLILPACSGKLSREELLKFDDDDDEAFLAAADAAAAEYQGRQRAEDPSVEDSDNRSQDVPADSEGDGPAQAHDGVPSSAVKPAPRTSNDVPWGQARTSHGAKLPGRGVRGVDEGSGRGEVGEVGEHPSSRPSRPTRREPSRNEDSYWIQVLPSQAIPWLDAVGPGLALERQRATAAGARPSDRVLRSPCLPPPKRPSCGADTISGFQCLRRAAPCSSLKQRQLAMCVCVLRSLHSNLVLHLSD